MWVCVGVCLRAGVFVMGKRREEGEKKKRERKTRCDICNRWNKQTGIHSLLILDVIFFLYFFSFFITSRLFSYPSWSSANGDIFRAYGNRENAPCQSNDKEQFHNRCYSSYHPLDLGDLYPRPITATQPHPCHDSKDIMLITLLGYALLFVLSSRSVSCLRHGKHNIACHRSLHCVITSLSRLYFIPRLIIDGLIDSWMALPRKNQVTSNEIRSIWYVYVPGSSALCVSTRPRLCMRICVCVHSVYIYCYGTRKKVVINRHMKLAGEKWATEGLQLNSDADARQCRSNGFLFFLQHSDGIKEAMI